MRVNLGGSSSFKLLYFIGTGMGVSGVFRSIIHITCVEHAHFKRHDPGREARIDEPLEVRVADLERQRVGELARLLPAQADDASVNGGHKDLPVGQSQAVEDRLGIDRYAGQIPAVVSAESHHHGRSAGVERKFVRACIFGCRDGASGEDRIPSQGHASNQQRNFSRPEIGHLGWFLLLGEGHVVVLQLAVEFFHPFVGAEQMISVERVPFTFFRPKPKTVASSVTRMRPLGRIPGMMAQPLARPSSARPTRVPQSGGRREVCSDRVFASTIAATGTGQREVNMNLRLAPVVTAH